MSASWSTRCRSSRADGHVTDSLNTADALAANPATIPPERDLMSKFDGLIAERQALLDSGVTDPFAIVMEQVKSPTEAVIKGKDTILLGTYNYMGMTFDPDVIQAGKDALDKFGSGTNGSRMLNGTFRDHMEVEQALRETLDRVVAAVVGDDHVAIAPGIEQRLPHGVGQKLTGYQNNRERH